MSKKVVPQELQEQIIDLYVNRGYGKAKIKRELNLPFGETVIKRVLVENGIQIRDLKTATKLAGERKKILVSREIQEQIIVKNTDFRKYSINDDYDFESHNGAWLLGFIASDGYLPNGKGSKNRVTIALGAVDKEILERIKEELSYTGPVNEYESSVLKNTHKSYPMVSLSFTSKKIRQAIESYGITNNKTFNLVFPRDLIKEEYMFDFIRGYVDGDGSVYPKRDQLNLSVTGASYNFITEMYEYIKAHLDLPYGGSIGKDHDNLAFRFGAADANIICSKLYDNDYLSLSRKKEKFNQLRE